MHKLEYLWLDGCTPTQIRFKTKVVKNFGKKNGDAPIWGFDGSSTDQAPGKLSDCVLRPVYTCPDPIRGGYNILVLCEVLKVDMTPHTSNNRAYCKAISEEYKSFKPLFGIEQEYTFFSGDRPLGWPSNGFPAPQGGYYCGVGADEVYGREIVEEHSDACIKAGLAIGGTNGEVMMGQWEFQIGPVGIPEVGDQLWIARWLLYRIAEKYNISATLDPKPVKGDWNGAGAHTNFSTKEMRSSYEPVIAACEALGRNVD